MREQVLSFNLGSLGFLTNHYWNNFNRDVSNVIHGCERLEHCMEDDPDVRALACTTQNTLHLLLSATALSN